MSSDPIEVLRELAASWHRAALNCHECGKPSQARVFRECAAQVTSALASLSAPKHKAGDNMEAGAGHVQGSDADECPKCGDQLDYDKFSDAVCIGTFYFDVHITACPGCGYIHHDRTWAE